MKKLPRGYELEKNLAVLILSWTLLAIRSLYLTFLVNLVLNKHSQTLHSLHSNLSFLASFILLFYFFYDRCYPYLAHLHEYSGIHLIKLLRIQIQSIAPAIKILAMWNSCGWCLWLFIGFGSMSTQ